MFLNAKIHFLLQIALKVVLKSVFYISHLTNQWGQTEETIAHVYPLPSDDSVLNKKTKTRR